MPDPTIATPEVPAVNGTTNGASHSAPIDLPQEAANAAPKGSKAERKAARRAAQLEAATAAATSPTEAPIAIEAPAIETAEAPANEAAAEMPTAIEAPAIETAAAAPTAEVASVASEAAPEVPTVEASVPKVAAPTGMRVRMKVWIDPATRKRYLMPTAIIDPRSGLMTAYAMSDEDTKVIKLTPPEWNALPFFYFQEDGPAPRATARPVDVIR